MGIRQVYMFTTFIICLLLFLFHKFFLKGEELYEQENWKVDLINSRQESWVAASYPQFEVSISQIRSQGQVLC